MKATTKKKLVDSVVHAQGPGACKYVVGEKPHCVIGQYAFRCGVTIQGLRGWGGLSAEDILTNQMWTGGGADSNLLQALQAVWDACLVAEEEDVARLYMLLLIECWEPGVEGLIVELVDHLQWTRPEVALKWDGD